MNTNLVTVVTSCSIEGWNKYGRKCLASMGQFWPKEAIYYLITEDRDLIPEDEVYRYTKSLDFQLLPLSASSQAVNFYARHANNATCKGMGNRPRGYDFRRDAWRFSKKVFAIQLAMGLHPYGRLIWLDADTITLKPVPIELLRRLPPEGSDIAYLDRSKIRYHSECGFVGYNLNNPATINFISAFASLYATDKVFELKEWHDSWVFDWLRVQTEIKNHQIPFTDFRHPFNFSELGQYMDHMKGRRKDEGLSTEHPRFTRRKG